MISIQDKVHVFEVSNIFGCIYIKIHARIKQVKYNLQKFYQKVRIVKSKKI